MRTMKTTTKRKWYATKAEWAAAMAAEADAAASACAHVRRHGETSRQRGRAHGMAQEASLRATRFAFIAERFRRQGK
jgi:hypothetical protein